MDASRPLAELEHAVQAGFQAFFVTGQAGAVLHRLLERLLQQVRILFALPGQRQQ